MELIIKLTENDFKDNLVLSAINTLFHANKAITGNIEVKPITDTPFEECDFVEDVTKQKTKNKTKEERVQDLKNYANSIYKDLSDAKKKSLKSFVAFYEKKIKEQDFNINPEKQFTQWWQNDKNNR